MITDVSPNTQAILLLTAPLIVGRSSKTIELLTPGEYKRLARCLHDMKRQPGDLLGGQSEDLFEGCRSVAGADRLRDLLARGFQLSQALERWQARAIWVVSRADEAYPKRLKDRLRGDSPPVLYGCGEPTLLERGGLAIVGSRHIDEALEEYTIDMGGAVAAAGKSVVSGGAKGIDQAAMRGTLDAGGMVCGVLADSLERQSMNREHRNLLMDGRLTLISPYDPGAGFNVGHAMQRNKLIYALADAALVVSSDVNKGGTWAGATEQLTKYKFVPVYVRSVGDESVGLNELKKKGAIPWPSLDSSDDLSNLIEEAAASNSLNREGLFTEISPEKPSEPAPAGEEQKQEAPRDHVNNASKDLYSPGDNGDVIRETLAPAEHFASDIFKIVSSSVQKLLSSPMKDTEIASALEISNAQAKAWLGKMVKEGLVSKSRKNSTYVRSESRLL